MDNIEMTVRRVLDNYSLPGDAQPIVAQVIVALEQREHQIAETLFNAAQAQNLDARIVRSEMEQAGIQFRQPALHSVGDDMLTEEAWQMRKDELNKMIDDRVQQWKDELGI